MITEEVKQETQQLTIRDFIYMDIEKLKSILAQIDKGLSEFRQETLTETEQETEITEGGIKGFFQRGGEEAYLWQTQRTESQTLHDHIYNFVENKLVKNQRIINIKEDLTEEDIQGDKQYEIIQNTSFILVSGRFFINDFTYMLDMMNKMNELMKAIYYGQLENNPQSKKLTQKQKREKVNQMVRENSLDPKQVESMTTMIEMLFKDKTIIKSVPFESHPKFRLVGTLKEEYLREDIHDIMYKYGTSPEENWYMFAQIASMPTSEKESLELPTSNNIESALNEVFDAIRGMEGAGITIAYPEIAVTPIAVYRE